MGLFGFIGKVAVGTALAPFTGGASLAAGLAAATAHEYITDTAREKGREEGYKQGHQAGSTETKTKLMNKLQADSNFKLGAFALGIYLAYIDGDDSPDEELSVIEENLGSPDSLFKEDFERKEYNNIMMRRPTYEVIKSQYLDQLDHDKAYQLHQFVRSIIDADGYFSPNEKRFWNEKWIDYMNEKGWTLKPV